MGVSERRPIVVVGSINVDLVSIVDRIPGAGETVSGAGFAVHQGGKGANQAVAVARLGYPVRMIGRLGEDGFGGELRSKMERAGVEMSGVRTVEGSSGVAVILVSAKGENCIVVTAGANAALRPEDLEAYRETIRGAGMVLTQLETPIETVERLGEMCREEGVGLMLDPAPARDLPAGLLRNVAWMTPNETEAAFYVGAEKGEKETAEALLGMGVQGVVLKLGERGVWVRTSAGDERVAAFPVTAVDTTAAGDAFNGAFSTALMMGKEAGEGARFAAAAAAVSVTRKGAQGSMARLVEVEAMLVLPDVPPARGAVTS